MRVLILGGNGMLGHQLANSLSRSHEVHCTFRTPLTPNHPLNGIVQSHPNIDALHWDDVDDTIVKLAPDAVINAIGVIKQRPTNHDAILNITLNALLPHQLADRCARADIRLVHFSTDCVFSGKRGAYTEDDHADAEDLYGRTKLLGEVKAPGVFTLRTSIIGLELQSKSSLIEWFLQQEDVAGYARAIYSGFTTLEMARIVERVLGAPSALGGIYNVSSDPISKYDLLLALSKALGRSTNIRRDELFCCDRSLLSQRFRELFQYSPPSWNYMIEELAAQIRERYP